MFKFLQAQEIKNANYAGPTRRFLAYTIDIFILAAIRYIFAYILLYLWYAKSFFLFANQYRQINQNSLNYDIKEFYQYFISQDIFFETILFAFLVFIIGSLYWILCPLTKLGATPGKAICKIKIVKEDNKLLNFKDLSYRYFVALTPWLFHLTMFLALYAKNKTLIVSCMVIVVLWYEPKVIKRSYRTIHDFICKTKVVNNK